MRRALLGVVFSGLLLAVPAAALKGKEHSELTNLAFKVALLHMQKQHPAHQEIWQKLEEDLLGSKAFEDERSFGDVTAVVDLVFFPEKLFLSLEDCEKDTLRVDEVCSVCEKDPKAAACEDKILKQGQERMERKQSQWFLKSLLVARLNSSHFDVGAQEAYNKFHGRALQQVRDRSGGQLQWEDWRLALRTEAVALHFLEDFFAPGHIMTRRQTHEELASRALHNRYNSKGLEAALGELAPLKELGIALDEALEKKADGKRDLDLPGGFRKLIDEELRFAEGRFGSSDVVRDGFSLYGDGDMRKDVARVQRTMLLLLAAYSIEEVLKEGISPGSRKDQLTLCYRPWSAEPQSRSDQPAAETTCRPWGAAAVLPVGASQATCWKELVDPVTNAPINPASQSQPRNLLIGYPLFICPTKECKGIEDTGTDERNKEGENYAHWTPGLSVARSAFARYNEEGSAGAAWDLDFIFFSLSVEQIQKRNGCEFLEDKWFKLREGKLGEVVNSLLSLGYSQTHSDDLDVSSWTIASQVPTRHSRYNRYYRLHAAYSEYSGPDLKSAVKPGVGLRYGIGISFLFLEGGVELGYRMDRPGHLEETAVFTLGLRGQYSLRP